MKQNPKMERCLGLFRELKGLRVPLYAANACYFLVLGIFPALVLLLGLLRYTSLESSVFTGLLEGYLPRVFREQTGVLVDAVSEKISGAALGISAVTVLWSASRGMFGILTGLKAVYRREENRGWFHARLVSVGYTLVLLAALPVTLGIHLFGGALLGLGWMLPLVQTGIFAALYMAVPGGGNTFRDSLPGAVLASAGWLVFSGGYSLYVTWFAPLRSLYGSVYMLALGMLWLYGCLCIFFYGGAWNAARQRWKKDVKEP